MLHEAQTLEPFWGKVVSGLSVVLRSRPAVLRSLRSFIIGNSVSSYIRYGEPWGKKPGNGGRVLHNTWRLLGRPVSADLAPDKLRGFRGMRTCCRRCRGWSTWFNQGATCSCSIHCKATLDPMANTMTTRSSFIALEYIDIISGDIFYRWHLEKLDSRSSHRPIAHLDPPCLAAETAVPRFLVAKTLMDRWGHWAETAEGVRHNKVQDRRYAFVACKAKQRLESSAVSVS